MLFLWCISKAALSIFREGHLSLPSSFPERHLPRASSSTCLLTYCWAAKEPSLPLLTEAKPVPSLLGTALQFGVNKTWRLLVSSSKWPWRWPDSHRGSWEPRAVIPYTHGTPAATWDTIFIPSLHFSNFLWKHVMLTLGGGEGEITE